MRCNGEEFPKFCDFCARPSKYHVDSSHGCFCVCGQDNCWDKARRSFARAEVKQ